jgi:hypothetical protein
MSDKKDPVNKTKKEIREEQLSKNLKANLARRKLAAKNSGNTDR